MEIQLKCLEDKKSAVSSCAFIHYIENIPDKTEFIYTDMMGIAGTTPSTNVFNKEIIPEFPLDFISVWAWDRGVMNRSLTYGSMVYIESPLIIYNTWKYNSGSCISEQERQRENQKLLVNINNYRKKWKEVFLIKFN
jgi:hypothetical protein